MVWEGRTRCILQKNEMFDFLQNAPFPHSNLLRIIITTVGVGNPQRTGLGGADHRVHPSQAVPMKIQLLRYHAVAAWTWNANDDSCGICRMAFDACCPDCSWGTLLQECPPKGRVSGSTPSGVRSLAWAWVSPKIVIRGCAVPPNLPEDCHNCQISESINFTPPYCNPPNHSTFFVPHLRLDSRCDTGCEGERGEREGESEREGERDENLPFFCWVFLRSSLVGKPPLESKEAWGAVSQDIIDHPPRT